LDTEEAMKALATARGIVMTVMALTLVVLTGCADDLYAPCDLDPADADPVVRACASEASSCVVENYPQCDTSICGRFNDSQPFCTTTWSADSDCPSGICAQFTVGIPTRYCVENTNL
jgi:hypothetical protein